MRRLSIKWQMGLVAALAVSGMLLLSVLQQYSMTYMERLGDSRILVSDIESGMLTLRRNEKDFMSRKNTKYVDQFKTNYEQILEHTTRLSLALKETGLDHTTAINLKSILAAYRTKFLALVELQKQIGLDHKSGLYGALRRAVHQAEDIMNAQNQDKLSKDMLMLRRREKDFMLRMDLKYLKKFNSDIAVLQQNLSESPISEDVKQTIVNAMNIYERDFKALVDANVKLGLSSKEGLLGEMRKTIHQSEEILSQLQSGTHLHIDSEMERITRQSILLSAILTVMILGLIIYIVPGVTRPVKQLADLMSYTSKEQDVTIRAEEKGPQEIAVMARAFNRMMTTLQNMIGHITDSSNQLSTAAEQLGVIARAANEGANQQQTETEQVATAMNEMTATVQEVARHASSAADASETADQNAHKGHSIVEQNRDSIHVLANEVMSTAEIIGDLSKESENIGTVLNVIRGIAEQTNLLALNAAIEAARAGEQGRGFAVVADEVRTLAQRSHESTQDIQTIVERLQQTAERAVSAMDKGKEQAQESAARSQVAAESLEAILQSVSVIKDMNLQIATASEEQASVSEEINRSVININDVTGDTITNTRQTMETGQSLLSMSTQLNEMVGKFKN
ncbi:MAG: methyl-accepting chemotaxis protein [Candidatus Thiodiazotropha sp. (ex Monitilora ramsayi)]|nr:methyl-accepting chemotaxis protein [Candidatus Thiodiazotropha sp. (ex Monitilora ramsayi)]